MPKLLSQIDATARVGRTAFVAGAILALNAMAAGTAAAAEFKIGFIMSLTGPSAALGKVALDGAQAGIEMINSSGGIGGAKAELVVCDVQSSEQQAVICARKLALQDKVNMMVGTGSSPQTVAIIPTVEAAGVPLFAVASSPESYTPVKNFVFKGIPGLTDQIPAIVDYFKAKKLLRVVVIHDNGPLGAAIGNIFKSRVEGAGITVAETLLYAPTDTDVTAQITRMRAAKPDAVLNIAITPPSGALIVKTMQQLGLDIPVVVGSNLQSKAFVALVGDAVENIIFPAAKVALKDLPASDPLHPAITAFRTAFAKVHPGQEPSSLSPWLVDPMLLAQKAGSTLGAKALDPKALRDAIEGLKGVNGIQGAWSFSPTDHGPDLSSGMLLVKFKNDSWVAAQ